LSIALVAIATISRFISSPFRKQQALLLLQAALWNTSTCRVFALTSSLRSFCHANIAIRTMSSSIDPDDIRQRKQALRKQIRAAVRELNPEETQLQSKQVWERVFELPVYKSAKSVGLFLSMPKGEINTDAILQHAIQNGKDVYVPQVGKNFEKCDMDLLKVVLDGSSSSQEIFHKSWPRNKWQIPEPPAEMPIITAQPGDIDLLVVPGLGFDQKGNRLGQGKGYYDRFIARMTANETPLSLVAVALKPQLVLNADIPVAEYDRRMDMVVLPNEIISSQK
jgi:5-formyltetrahydrofolate cyclo-ligase